MRVISKAAAILALVAVPSTVQAQAASTCMTEAEATALFGYALPEMLDTVANKCAKTLPPTSFMSQRGPALVANYRTTSAANWPLAKAAFFKTAGDDATEAAEVLAAMPDEAVKALVGSALTVIVGKDINPADCPTIDSLVESLAPLPMTNISALLVSLISLAGTDKDDRFRICAKS
jgi:hypothetical protein